MNINDSSFRETAFTFSSFLGQKEYKLSLAVPLPRFLTGAISRGPPSSHKYDLSPPSSCFRFFSLASNHTRLRVPFRSGAFGNEGAGGKGGQQTEGTRLGQIYRSPTKEPFSGPQIFSSWRFFGQTRVLSMGQYSAENPFVLSVRFSFVYLLFISGSRRAF